MVTAAEKSSPAEIEQELKLLIIDALKLEDVSPEEIDVEAPLVGEGLGLDSIDILELAMAVHRKFGIKTESDDSESHRIYSNVKSLAAHIFAQRSEN